MNISSIDDTLFQTPTPPPPCYKVEIEGLAWRSYRNLVTTILFPIKIYQAIHSLLGRLVVPASLSKIDTKELSIRSDMDWFVKRVAIEVDGLVVDGALLGRHKNIASKRWILYSNGNGEFFERNLMSSYFRALCYNLDANAVVFNYPGVGASNGRTERDDLKRSYQAWLAFLEDSEKGIGAKEIIGFGYSLGGGVQADAITGHSFKENVRYLFIKSHTFSNLSSIAKTHIERGLNLCLDSTSKLSRCFANVAGHISKWTLQLFGWNIDVAKSSLKLKQSEIILQTADVAIKTFLFQEEGALIQDDGLITPVNSLALSVLKNQSLAKNPKYVLGVPEKHHEPIWSFVLLKQKAEELLK